MNSVKLPGSVADVDGAACCLTMMSWLIDRPSPVPSPAGLVVKKGLNIFSFTSGGMPVPLSRMRISTELPRSCVVASSVGSKPPRRSPPCAGRGIEAVRDQVEQRARDLLRKQHGLAGAGVESTLQRDVEAGLLGTRAVIGQIEAFLHQRIDICGALLARSLARMQQHVLDDGVGALAVLHHLLEVRFQELRQLVDLLLNFSASSAWLKTSLSSSVSSTDSAEKLLMKLSGFLISWAMPAVS